MNGDADGCPFHQRQFAIQFQAASLVYSFDFQVRQRSSLWGVCYSLLHIVYSCRSNQKCSDAAAFNNWPGSAGYSRQKSVSGLCAAQEGNKFQLR